MARTNGCTQQLLRREYPDDRDRSQDEAVEEVLSESEFDEQPSVARPRRSEREPVRREARDLLVRFEARCDRPVDRRRSPDAHEDSDTVLQREFRCRWKASPLPT